MISKKFRLTEEEVKKVLKFWKPFFSYWMVLNYKNNNFENNRFAIIISWKNVDSSVERNFFRRRFYDIIEDNFKLWTSDPKLIPNYDIVFVLKKQTKLDKTKIESINWFDNDLKFLLKAIKKIIEEKNKKW